MPVSIYKKLSVNNPTSGLEKIISDGAFSFINEPKCVKILYDINKDNIENVKGGLVEFISDEPKIFLKVSTSFYHFVYDFLGTIFYLYEKDNNIKFILDIGEARVTKSSTNFIEFLEIILKDSEVKYQIVDFIGKKEFNMNNFYIKNPSGINLYSAPKVFKYLEKYIRDKNIKPFRKVYISRSIAEERKKKFYGNNLKDLSRSSYSRIDDERNLEDFFKKNNFEIVYPEDFKTFVDQINYFYEARLVVSITGGGLTNSIFMKNGAIVVEIITSLITNYNDRVNNILNLEEGQHHFYHAISYQKDHEYIGVINKDISSMEIINKFNNFPHLKSLLKDTYE